MRSQTEVLPHPIFATETAESFEENLLKSHFSLWLIKSAMYALAWYIILVLVTHFETCYISATFSDVDNGIIFITCIPDSGMQNSI